MLNLNCVICAELFGATDDVHVTTCGHMFHFTCLTQWLERSKTCPQCRNRCNNRNIFRLYFNLANLDASHIDVGSLQEQLDNAKLQAQMKEKELNKAAEQIKSLKETQKKCMKTISGLESKIQKTDFLVLSYCEQIKLLKNETKMMADLRNQVKELKFQLEAMEGVSTILTATSADVEKLLSNECDPKVLAVWVTTLKRELRQVEHKKNDIRNMLKVVQSDLRKETHQRKEQEERILLLESENYQLQEKIKALESSKETTNNKEATSTAHILNVPILSRIHDELRPSISPTIKENIKKIEDSNSPYLNIKSSSLGLVPLFKRNHEPPTEDLTKWTAHKIAKLKVSPIKAPDSASAGSLRKMTSDLSDKYSIFKKPRLGMAAAAASAGSASLLKPLGPNYVFNGFGGSERVDPFSSRDDNTKESENSNNQRKLPRISVTSSLNSRLKAGGLRNFKTTK